MLFGANAVLAGGNLALVALQRYNRARMIKRVDEELQTGNSFRAGYENDFGIDALAVANFHTAQLEGQGVVPQQTLPGYSNNTTGESLSLEVPC